MLSVEFRSHNITFANKIKNREYSTSIEGINLFPESLLLSPHSAGGKEKKATIKQVNASCKLHFFYRGVETIEDIKVFCFEHFENKLQ
jgi:hypothetical protein